MSYAELQSTSNFSFLRGASHPQELMEEAIRLGYTAMAITDRNTLAGIVRAYAEAKKNSFKFIPACRLDLIDGPSLLAYPTNVDGYTRLTNLLTTGNMRTEKGKCELYKADVYAACKDMLFLAVPPAQLNAVFEFEEDFIHELAEYHEALGSRLFLSATRYYQGDDGKRLHRLDELARRFKAPMVATNDVHYHVRERRALQDVVTCIREKCTIYDAGFRLHPNAERFMKPVEEMQRLFKPYPGAIHRTLEIVEACQFSLDQLAYRYPKEITTEGRTPMEELTHLTWKGAKERYGSKIPKKVKDALDHELKFIAEMKYAEYFLTVYDIVRYAREQNILCQGRGSAANSAVCYVLGITSVDPTEFELLFERFISSARNEPPDIDVDFEHERREEVMQYVFRKYGRDRAAVVATVTQQHYRGAIRDVGKAMGLSVDTLNRLSAAAKDSRGGGFKGVAWEKEEGLNLNDPHLKKTLELTEAFIGFPRQLGQHTGGFVITDGRLSDLCPILNARMEDRTCIEWNKDDIDVLGFMKVDVLALGMLTCIRKAFNLLKEHYGIDHTLASIPQKDAKVYEMISHADTIGVFQIESRAQQSMLPRLRPECFYDLVIEVAIVRPGPIQGNMVHPYLRRRNNLEAEDYPSDELKEILKRTKGVPLFQEQAMSIAIVAAGFTPAEADELRRSMATFKSEGKIKEFERKLIDGMLKNNYPREFAQRIFEQLKGFGSYGFPESHAVSFALLVYVSSWIKCHHPDVFACALLNSMPMGFYQPAQIVIDARKHHVEVREVDVNYSFWDNSLEGDNSKCKALRLGFRQAKGLKEEEIALLIQGRGEGFTSMDQLRKLGLSDAALENLADADAFRSLGLDRRQALWEVSTLDRPVALFRDQASEIESIRLPSMSVSEHVVQDYAATSLSLKAHPVSFVREKLDQLRIMPTGSLKDMKNGMKVSVAGLVLVRQRPQTASGVCFMTIEDETGFANVVLFQKVFDKYRKAILQSKLIMIEGMLQIEGEVIHVVAGRCYNISTLLRNLNREDTEKSGKQLYDSGSETLFPGSRDFH